MLLTNLSEYSTKALNSMFKNYAELYITEKDIQKRDIFISPNLINVILTLGSTQVLNNTHVFTVINGQISLEIKKCVYFY